MFFPAESIQPSEPPTLPAPDVRDETLREVLAVIDGPGGFRQCACAAKVRRLR
jgi:hypothetical protein